MTSQTRTLVRGCTVVPLTLALLTVQPARSEPSTGWVLAAGAGRPTLSADLTSAQQSFDDDSDAWGFGLGYRFGRFLSVEAWHQDLGDFDGMGELCPSLPGFPCPAQVPNRGSLEARSLRLMGHLPLGRRLELYGFAGPIDWTLDVDLLGPGPRPLGLSLSDTDVVHGAGLELLLRRGFHAFVDYERFSLDLRGPWFGLRWRS